MAGDALSAADPSFDRYARLVRRALGVPVALVSIVEANRQVFPGADGLPRPYQVARETPLSHSMCQYVVRDQAPLVVSDARADERLVDNLAIADLGVVAYAGWPLTDHTGRTVGSLCAIDGEPREWTEEDLETLADLAGACSAEIAERELRRSATAQSRAALELVDHHQLLLSFSESLASVDTYEGIAAALADLAVAELGCTNAGMWLISSLTADTADKTGDPGRGVLRFVPTETNDWERATVLREATIDLSTPLGYVGATGSALFFADQAGQDEQFPATVSSRPEGGGRAAVPLVVGSRLVGCLGLVWPEDRAFSEVDRVGIFALASYVAQAVNRAVVLQDRVDSSNILQSAMLTPLPEPDGLLISARYQPAAKREQVGGDWYDAFELATGAVALVIGDVVGHDIEAAAAMGQARSILRAIAWPGDKRPAASLESLDQALDGLHLDVLATLV
ncbi:MAG: rsbP 2 [Marmoricola sp.]|nr:rsbP 2 [Marmoricola sp.]